MQVLHVAGRVQRVPRPHARLRLARLEHEQQRVEAGDDLGARQAEEGGRGGGRGVQEVVELVGVGLYQLVCVSDEGERGGRRHTLTSYSSCSPLHQTA